MTKIALVVLVTCLCCAHLMAQANQIGPSTSDVLAGPNGLCSDNQGNPWRSCWGYWSEGTASGGGSAAGTSAYGVLRFAAGALTGCHEGCSEAVTTADVTTHFQDTFTFVGVPDGTYYLKVTLRMVGAVDGDYSEIASQALVNVTAKMTNTRTGEAELCAFNVVAPSPLGSVQEVCTKKLQIAGTDTVEVSGDGASTAEAGIYNDSTGVRQTVITDFGEPGIGAFYGYQVVDSKGFKVDTAVIISASGHQYPDF